MKIVFVERTPVTSRLILKLQTGRLSSFKNDVVLTFLFTVLFADLLTHHAAHMQAGYPQSLQ